MKLWPHDMTLKLPSARRGCELSALWVAVPLPASKLGIPVPRKPAQTSPPVDVGFTNLGSAYSTISVGRSAPKVPQDAA
jgi:hypothetical protein